MPLVKNSSLELGTNINLLLVKGSLKMQIPTRHFTIFNVSLILLYQGWNIYYKCRKCECNKSRDYMTEFFCKKQSSTMNFLDSNPFLVFPLIVFSIMSSTDQLLLLYHPLFLYLYQTFTVCNFNFSSSFLFVNIIFLCMLHMKRSTHLEKSTSRWYHNTHIESSPSTLCISIAC